MKRMLVVVLSTVALVVACGNDDGGETSPSEAAAQADTSSADDEAVEGDGGGDDASGGAVAEPAPSGQATASVDGVELAFEEVLTSGCSISEERITYAFVAADGVTTLAGGLNRIDGAWLGSIAIDVPNPDGEGILGYYPAPTNDGTLEDGAVAVDGSSMSYSGPMLLQPVNDGSNPPPISVGEGTVSATC